MAVKLAVCVSVGGNVAVDIVITVCVLMSQLSPKVLFCETRTRTNLEWDSCGWLIKK